MKRLVLQNRITALEEKLDEYRTWYKIDKQRIKKLCQRAETAEAELAKRECTWPDGKCQGDVI